MCVPNSAVSENLVRRLPPSPFTHPRVGQAERLACRKRQPNAFLRAEARAHFYGHRPNDRENSSKNLLKTGAAFTLCLIRYIKEKGLPFPLVLRAADLPPCLAV